MFFLLYSDLSDLSGKKGSHTIGTKAAVDEINRNGGIRGKTLGFDCANIYDVSIHTTNPQWGVGWLTWAASNNYTVAAVNVDEETWALWKDGLAGAKPPPNIPVIGPALSTEKFHSTFDRDLILTQSGEDTAVFGCAWAAMGPLGQKTIAIFSHGESGIHQRELLQNILDELNYDEPIFQWHAENTTTWAPSHPGAPVVWYDTQAEVRSMYLAQVNLALESGVRAFICLGDDQLFHQTVYLAITNQLKLTGSTLQRVLPHLNIDYIGTGHMGLPVGTTLAVQGSYQVDNFVWVHPFPHGRGSSKFAATFGTAVDISARDHASLHKGAGTVMKSYLSARMLGEVLRKGANATKEAVYDNVFAPGTVPMDDITLGVYSDYTSKDKRVVKCNQGIHYASVTRGEESKGLRVIAEINFQPKDGECKLSVRSTTPPLQVGYYREAETLSAANEGTAAERKLNQLLEYGTAVHRDLQTAFQLFSEVIAINGTAAAARNSSIVLVPTAKAVVTAVLNPILDAANLAAAVKEGNPPVGQDLFVLNPLPSTAFPHVSHSPSKDDFYASTVQVFQTLQQEIFAWCYQLSAVAELTTLVTDTGAARNGISVVRPSFLNDLGTEQYNVDYLVERSLYSFGFDAQDNSTGWDLRFFDTFSALEAFEAGTSAKSNVLFAMGLGEEANVTSLLRLMEGHPQLTTFLSYSELVLQWHFLNGTLKNSTGSTVNSRLYWASSLPNWMYVANQFSQTSVVSSRIPDQFLRQFGGDVTKSFQGTSATGHNMTATERAFLVDLLEDPFLFYNYATTSALYSIVTSFPSVRPYLLESSVTRSLLYMSQVLHVAGLTFGNFLRNPGCSASNIRQCECSHGGRTVFVYRGDVAVAQAVMDPESTYTFSECEVPYQDRPVPLGNSARKTGLTETGVALASSLSIVGLIILVAFVAILFIKSGGRNQAGAVTDSSKPFAVMFTDIENSSALWAAVPDAMLIALDQHHTILRKVIKKYKGFEVKTIGDAFMIVHKDPEQAFDMCVAIQQALNECEWPEGITEGYRRISARHWLQSSESMETLISSLRQHIKSNDQPKIDSALVATLRESDYDEEVLAPVLWTLPMRLLDAVHQDAEAWNGIRIRIGLHYGTGDIQWDPVALSHDYYGNVVNTAARVEAKASGGQLLVSKDLVDILRGARRCMCKNQGTHELKGIAAPLQLYHADSVKERREPETLLLMSIERQQIDDEVEALDLAGVDDLPGGVTHPKHRRLEIIRAEQQAAQSLAPWSAAVMHFDGSSQSGSSASSRYESKEAEMAEIDMLAEALRVQFSRFRPNDRESRIEDLVKAWHIFLPKRAQNLRGKEKDVAMLKLVASQIIKVQASRQGMTFHRRKTSLTSSTHSSHSALSEHGWAKGRSGTPGFDPVVMERDVLSATEEHDRTVVVATNPSHNRSEEAQNSQSLENLDDVEMVENPLLMTSPIPQRRV